MTNNDDPQPTNTRGPKSIFYPLIVASFTLRVPVYFHLLWTHSEEFKLRIRALLYEQKWQQEIDDILKEYEP